MAAGTVIITKYSDSVQQPITDALSKAEQAYSYASNKLWIGKPDGVTTVATPIGGAFYTDQLKHVSTDFGKTIANHAIITDSSNKIDLINIDDVNIDGRTISSTDANGDLIISPNGTGELDIHANTNIVGHTTMSETLIVDDSVAIDNLLIDNNIISATNTNGAITLKPQGTGAVTIDTTHAFVVASGLEASRPSAASVGNAAIRYNESDNRFEGTVGGVWTGLGGVVDIDQDTYIIAETGQSDDDVITFVAENTTEATIAKYVPAIGGTPAIGGLQITDYLKVPVAEIGRIYSDVYLSDDLYVEGHTVIDGNLTVHGTTTSVNSTVTTLNDPVINVGNYDALDKDGNSLPVVVDLIDRGVSLDYGVEGADPADPNINKTGFFGMDMATKRFTFKPIDMATKRFTFKPIVDTADQDYVAPWGDAQFHDLYMDNSIEVDQDLVVHGNVTFDNDVPVTSGGTGMSSFTGDGVFISNTAGTDLNFITGSLYDIIQFNAAGVPVASNVIDGGYF